MHTLSTALSQWSALTAFNLTDNYAENSGAIHASESKVYVRGETTIAYNAACKWHWRCSVYLDMSELHCQGNISVKVLGNGVHVISSSINVVGNITNNSIADENMYSCSFWIWEGWSTLSGNEFKLIIQIQAKQWAILYGQLYCQFSKLWQNYSSNLYQQHDL